VKYGKEFRAHFLSEILEGYIFMCFLIFHINQLNISNKSFILFFSQSPALSQLIQLYVCRNYLIWKECGMLAWLERNVHVVLDRVDKCDAFVVECEEKRKRNYRKAPRNVLRHIVLSDIKEAMEILAEVSFVQRSLKKRKKDQLLYFVVRTCYSIASCIGHSFMLRANLALISSWSIAVLYYMLAELLSL